MPDFLEDYKAYYRLRMQRNENNPDYPETFRVEKAMYEAIASCSTLEECREDLQRLSNENAIARVIDTFRIRMRHYEELKNPIQVEACKRIIEKAGMQANVAELMTMVNEESNLLNLAMTADSIYPFDDPGNLERIEVWEQAEVPDKYKSRYRQYADEEKQKLRDAYLEAETNMKNFNPGWKFDFNRVLEERHRRKIPFPDKVLATHIQQTKDILNAR